MPVDLLVPLARHVCSCAYCCLSLSAAEQSWGSSTAEHNSWVEQTSSAPGSWAEQASHSSHAPNAWGSAGANSQVRAALCWLRDAQQSSQYHCFRQMCTWSRTIIVLIFATNVVI